MKRNLVISLLVLFLVAACGGQSASTPVPTAKPLPTYSYTQPTLAAGIPTQGGVATQQVTEASVAVALDPDAVAAGQGRYTALNCADCHGDKGQGNGDKGPALVGLTLSEDDFISFMRSGGKLGTAHQYASNRLSLGGAQNLYQYLKSLSAS